jgi:hypothetical protein
MTHPQFIGVHCFTLVLIVEGKDKDRYGNYLEDGDRKKISA